MAMSIMYNYFVHLSVITNNIEGYATYSSSMKSLDEQQIPVNNTKKIDLIFLFFKNKHNKLLLLCLCVLPFENVLSVEILKTLHPLFQVWKKLEIILLQQF